MYALLRRFFNDIINLPSFNRVFRFSRTSKVIFLKSLNQCFYFDLGVLVHAMLFRYSLNLVWDDGGGGEDEKVRVGQPS